MIELNEKSTGKFVIRFRNKSTGDLITMETLKWTLTDKKGTVINDRDGENVDSPGSEAEIELFDEDLALTDEESDQNSVYRYLIAEATYLNNEGVERPLTTQQKFVVINLKSI